MVKSHARESDWKSMSGKKESDEKCMTSVTKLSA
jgi:hypothetical protein